MCLFWLCYVTFPPSVTDTHTPSQVPPLPPLPAHPSTRSTRDDDETTQVETMGVRGNPPASQFIRNVTCCTLNSPMTGLGMGRSTNPHSHVTVGMLGGAGERFDRARWAGGRGELTGGVELHHRHHHHHHHRFLRTANLK